MLQLASLRCGSSSQRMPVCRRSAVHALENLRRLVTYLRASGRLMDEGCTVAPCGQLVWEVWPHHALVDTLGRCVLHALKATSKDGHGGEQNRVSLANPLVPVSPSVSQLWF